MDASLSILGGIITIIIIIICAILLVLAEKVSSDKVYRAFLQWYCILLVLNLANISTTFIVNYILVDAAGKRGLKGETGDRGEYGDPDRCFCDESDKTALGNATIIPHTLGIHSHRLDITGTEEGIDVNHDGTLIHSNVQKIMDYSVYTTSTVDNGPFGGLYSQTNSPTFRITKNFYLYADFKLVTNTSDREIIEISLGSEFLLKISIFTNKIKIENTNIMKDSNPINYGTELRGPSGTDTPYEIGVLVSNNLYHVSVMKNRTMVKSVSLRPTKLNRDRVLPNSQYEFKILSGDPSSSSNANTKFQKLYYTRLSDNSNIPISDIHKDFGFA